MIDIASEEFIRRSWDSLISQFGGYRRSYVFIIIIGHAVLFRFSANVYNLVLEIFALCLRINEKRVNIHVRGVDEWTIENGGGDEFKNSARSSRNVSERDTLCALLSLAQFRAD